MKREDYFPEVLNDWIQAAGKSDAEIAEAIGASRYTVWRARTGSATTSLEVLASICTHLDKPLKHVLREKTIKKFASIV